MSRPAPVRGVALHTERFDIRPIRPLEFSRQSFAWTADTEAFDDLGWRVTGWTWMRWWRKLRRLSGRKRICHGIWPKGEPRPIGLHTLTFADGTVTIGVVIGNRSWWGRNVVVEVRGRIIDDCFERLGVARVQGFVRSRNLPSVYNYGRLGFTHEGTMRQSRHGPDGGRADMLVFGLLRDEWQARRSEGQEQ